MFLTLLHQVAAPRRILKAIFLLDFLGQFLQEVNFVVCSDIWINLIALFLLQIKPRVEANWHFINKSSTFKNKEVQTKIDRMLTNIHDRDNFQ